MAIANLYLNDIDSATSPLKMPNPPNALSNSSTFKTTKAAVSAFNTRNHVLAALIALNVLHSQVL